MSDNTWERIKETQADLHRQREIAALDIAEEIVWKLTGSKQHPYEKQVGEIADALESIL